MKASFRLVCCLGVLLAAAVGASSLFSRETLGQSSAQKAGHQKLPEQKASTTSSQGSGGQIARGQYLVENVAMCAECHTPRLANGELDHSRWLQGASIWITPVHPDPNWAMHAPPIAGFAGFTEEQGERILEKGIGPNGLPIQRPMHIYHMSHEDAQSIIAYLKSLPAAYPRE